MCPPWILPSPDRMTRLPLDFTLCSGPLIFIDHASLLIYSPATHA
jgi:hypothetical protein